MGKGATGVTGGDSPTVRRRELGALLRTLRTEAGMTVEQVAERLLVSSSKISRLETGQRGANPRDIRDLCDLYEVDSAQREYLAELAREGVRKGWWQRYDLPYATYVGLEADAVAISDFESGVVPGLLQTPAYARALHERGIPHLSAEVIDQRVEERRRRQAILDRQDPAPPRFRAIIDEAILHRVVGGPEVMRDQLQRILDTVHLRKVTIQALPFSVGAHPALDSTFTVLEFSPPVPDVVYSEGLVGHIFRDRPEDVHRYQEIFEYLSGQSLSPEETLTLVQAAQARLAKLARLQR
jgi:transcriptional regulator with XRE-family HTH domain